MSALTSAGKTLKRTYWNQRVLFIWIPPWIVYLVLDFTCRPGWWLVAIYAGSVFFCAWVWNLRTDWKEMQRHGMFLADKTAKAAISHGEKRSVSLKMDRVFPRLIWVMVTTDRETVHLYEGICLFSRHVPLARKIVKSRFVRQLG